MKIFQQDYKINFVDDNNVFVGFDNYQSCCEHFGWMLSRELPNHLSDGQIEIEPDNFQFDTEFFREEIPCKQDMDCGGVAVFRLVKGDEEIFLTLWNAHNGYYGHGFSMECGKEQLRYGCL